MSIYDIENSKSRKLFQMLVDAGKEGITFFDAQEKTKTSSYYRRIGDLEDKGYQIQREKRNIFDDVDNKDKSITFYILQSENPCPLLKAERNAAKVMRKRDKNLIKKIKVFEKLSANGQVAACPVCMSETSSQKSKGDDQHE